MAAAPGTKSVTGTTCVALASLGKVLNMNVDDEYGSVHWQTATDLESSRSEQDTDPFASFDVQVRILFVGKFSTVVILWLSSLTVWFGQAVTYCQLFHILETIHNQKCKWVRYAHSQHQRLWSRYFHCQDIPWQFEQVERYRCRERFTVCCPTYVSHGYWTSKRVGRIIRNLYFVSNYNSCESTFLSASESQHLIKAPIIDQYSNLQLQIPMSCTTEISRFRLATQRTDLWIFCEHCTALTWKA